MSTDHLRTRKTVILIDDEQMFAEVFTSKFNMWRIGFTVVTNAIFGNVTPAGTAAFIAHCRSLIEAHRDDCAAIFIDLGLDPSDQVRGWQRGFQVGAELRAAFYEIPILVLTAFSEKVTEGYYYDFDAFIDKHEFHDLDTNDVLGILHRTMLKRGAMVESLPQYYQQHVHKKGPSLAILSAFGVSFTGKSNNLETALDTSMAIQKYFSGQERMTSILFADMADSTAIKQEHGFFEGLRLTRTHNHVLTDIINRRGGTVVKYIGDAVMARWDYDRPDAVDFRPLLAAIDAQESLLDLNRGDSHGTPIRTKIGVAVGKVADFYGNDPQGPAVDLAARVQALAGPEQILITKKLVDMVGLHGKQKLVSRAGVAMNFQPEEYLGSQRSERFKGFKDPVDVYEIRWNVALAPAKT